MSSGGTWLRGNGRKVLLSTSSSAMQSSRVAICSSETCSGLRTAKKQNRPSAGPVGPHSVSFCHCHLVLVRMQSVIACADMSPMGVGTDTSLLNAFAILTLAWLAAVSNASMLPLSMPAACKIQGCSTAATSLRCILLLELMVSVQPTGCIDLVVKGVGLGRADICHVCVKISFGTDMIALKWRALVVSQHVLESASAKQC